MASKKIKLPMIKELKTYWPLALAIVFLLGLTFAVIIPLYRQINALRAKIMVEKNELETRYIRRQAIRRTLVLLSRIKIEWPKLFNSFYPEFGQEINFLNRFEKAADKFNLEQTPNLEPSLGSPLSADIQIVPLQIALDGQYQDIISYLHEIENQPMILRLKEIKITRLKSNGLVHATVRFESHWHKK